MNLRLPIALLTLAPVAALSGQTCTTTITGKAAFADFSKQKPGICRKITVADLPEPMPAEAVVNGPSVVPRPEGAWPIAPPGFKVELYAGGEGGAITFKEPRLIRTAPNGDLFVADTSGGQIRVLRGLGADGKAQQAEVFATGLDHPFGIAFYPAVNPQWVYVGNTTSVVRFAYKTGDLKATSTIETLVPDLPGGGGHRTRDIVFSKDGRMLVSVGSASNVDDADTHPAEFHRADVLAFTPEGKFLKIYASGIRNCVGEAINPITGKLWCSTNERDNLGNNLVPDYITSVPEDGFFGWPWFYMGGHQDPRLEGKHPELKSRVLTPDVLLQPHMASLELTFYNPAGKSNFPAEFKGDIFAAEHGSWNRAQRGGYELIHIPVKNGQAQGFYQDFLTGFVTEDGKVWGRPVGVTVANDGSLFVTDDGSKSIWHVTYTGKPTSTRASR